MPAGSRLLELDERFGGTPKADWHAFGARARRRAAAGPGATVLYADGSSAACVPAM